MLIGLLSYYLIFSSLSLNANENKRKLKINKISLLICAKDELENLKLHLPIWAAQKGLQFEIIIVNDNSTDGSKVWLDKQTESYPFLKILHLEAHENDVLKGKRFALFSGLELVQNEYVVLSDADCYPKSDYWLKEMAQSFNEDTEIVLGYSPYKTTNDLLGQLIDYETLLTALQYLSFAKIGFPYMGVGRNIAYKKSILNRDKFLESNLSIGGDDDLLVAKLANQKNTSISIKQDSFVYTLPENSFTDWKHQKKRHYNTAKHYDFKNIILVGAFGLLNSMFYFILFLMICLDFSILVIIILYLFKHCLMLATNLMNLKQFKQSNLVYRIWYIDLIFMITFLFLHISSLFNFKNVWNKK